MADTFKIKKPRPLFRRSLRKAPAAPLDDRIIVRELPPESETEGGIQLADANKDRLMAGILVTAGDAAADYFYDRGVETGDTIHYARYAGVVEEWQHIVGKDDESCAHDGRWDHIPRPSKTLSAVGGGADAKAQAKWALVGGDNDNISLRECGACGTIIASERMIAMSCKDVILSCDLQERIESGEVVRYRGVTADGQTRHYIVRTSSRPECFGPVDPAETPTTAWTDSMTSTLMNGKRKES